MVDHQAAPDLGAGVDLDAGAVPGDLGVEPGQEPQVVPPKPVGHPVEDDGVYAGVEQKDLQAAAGRRVPGLIGPEQFP